MCLYVERSSVMHMDLLIPAMPRAWKLMCLLLLHEGEGGRREEGRAKEEREEEEREEERGVIIKRKIDNKRMKK